MHGHLNYLNQYLFRCQIQLSTVSVYYKYGSIWVVIKFKLKNNYYTYVKITREMKQKHCHPFFKLTLRILDSITIYFYLFKYEFYLVKTMW